MKILQIHNYYQHSGGEDTVFSAEVALLREHGHTVLEYIEENKRILGMGGASVAFQTVWSQPTYKKFLAILGKEKPDLAHFHNTFPLISPSAYYACRKLGVPVIQSLDNPRLMCPAATFYRNAGLCIDCLGKTPPWPGILHGCYHNSRIHTGVVAAMLTLHRMMKTWQNQVTLFLVATHFYRDLFIRGGLPSGKLVVKQHFVKCYEPYAAKKNPAEYALFIARLDPEKGVWTLLEAWKKLKYPLVIRGEGHLEQEIRAFIRNNHLDMVKVVGRLSRADLTQLIKKARFLVWPANGYYETFGLAAVECYTAGVPVIASRIGVMTEIVRDGVTGLHFNPGDVADLAAKVEWLWNRPEEAERMGRLARKEYEQKYTPERNYKLLTEIYQQAIINPQ